MVISLQIYNSSLSALKVIDEDEGRDQKKSQELEIKDILKDRFSFSSQYWEIVKLL